MYFTGFSLGLKTKKIGAKLNKAYFGRGIMCIPCRLRRLYHVAADSSGLDSKREVPAPSPQSLPREVSLIEVAFAIYVTSLYPVTLALISLFLLGNLFHKEMLAEIPLTANTVLSDNEQLGKELNRSKNSLATVLSNGAMHLGPSPQVLFSRQLL